MRQTRTHQSVSQIFSLKKCIDSPVPTSLDQLGANFYPFWLGIQLSVLTFLSHIISELLILVIDTVALFGMI